MTLRIQNLSYKQRLVNILISCILLIFVLDAAFLNGLPPIRASHFNVYPMDIVSVSILFFLLFSRSYNPLRIKRISILPLCLGFLLLLSYLRGVALFGIEQATNSVRNYLYFYSTFMLVISSKNVDKTIKKITFSWGIVSWILAFIVIVRWVLVGMGIIDISDWASAGGLEMRVINSANTFVLFQSVILSMTLKDKKGKLPFQRILPFIFIPIIILLQHRTIWVCGLLLGGFLLIREKRKRPYFLGALLLLLVLIFLLLLIFWESPSLQAFADTARNLQNLEWRIEGWQRLLSPERYKNIFDYFIGQPFGTGYARLIRNSGGILYEVTASPHNFYIETYLNIGLIGIVIFLAIYFRIIRKKSRHNYSEWGLPLLLLIFSQMIYYLTYSPSYEQGMILGAAIILLNSGELNESINEKTRDINDLS